MGDVAAAALGVEDKALRLDEDGGRGAVVGRWGRLRLTTSVEATEALLKLPFA
jgi:hypothetical protein